MLIFALLACHKTEPDVADTVFTGTIHVTVAETTTAIAVKNGTIVAKGADATAMIGTGTQKVDLGTGVAYPGMQDAHTHLLAGNFAMQRLVLLGVPSMQDMASKVQTYAAANPDEPWIVGYGWLGESITDPSGAPIDAVLPDRPALLISSSGHAAIVNSKALQLAGIDKNTPDPPDGTIARDGDGNPTGYLLEGAIKLVSSVVVAAYDDTAMEKGLVDQLNTFSSGGLTGISEILAVPGIDLGRPWIFEDLEQQGQLPMRVTWYLPVFAASDVDAIAAVKDQYSGTLVQWGGGKVWVDGSMGTVEAWVTQPYAGSTDNYGLHYWDEPGLEGLITEAEAKQVPLKFHANGDAAVEAALTALENVNGATGGLTQHYDIEHAVLLSADDRARMAQIGVVASVQPAHYLPSSIGAVAQALGSRFADCYNFRGLLDAGVPLAMGTDWPVWPQPAPLLTVWDAADGANPNGTTVAEALTAYTEGSAMAINRDDLGKLDVGDLADVVVLGSEPLTASATDLPNIEVQQVWVNGKRIH